jgi:PAS domain S-box-containing protein
MADGWRAPGSESDRAEIEELRAQLREAEDALEAIRSGEVDALVVGGPLGQQIYSITNADRPYRLLIEQMKEGAVTLLSNGLIAYCNDAFALLLGKRAADIRGTPIQQFVLPVDLGPFEDLLTSDHGGRMVLTLVGNGHTEVPVSLSSSPLPDNSGGRIVCAIITDLRQLRQSTQELADAGVRLADQIAVRERAEALLHQAQKMEVVGQLTGGLAHDFNNLLMIIGGNLDVMRKRVTDDQIIKRLDQVLVAVQRGAKLTQQLLAFSRIQTLSPQSICINDLLPDVEMLVRRAVGSAIEVRFDLLDNVWFCRADPNQLESAILNLAINARDAMPTGGSLTVTTENKLLDVAAAAALGEVAPGRYVAITLRDSGTGMPKDVLARVFEPFFTTKEVGKGSGLGLSQVYGFARQSGGHIAIESQIGEGTAVRLYLPWTEAAELPVANEEEEAIQLPVVAAGKILVVEDNNELRELATQLLQGLGYAACSAGTGAEALATLAQDPGIDFLFTDILMPGMTGFELAVEVRQQRPAIAILLTSGFPGNFLPGARHNGEFEIIRKPFTQAELATAVSRVRRRLCEPKRGLGPERPLTADTPRAAAEITR